MFCRNGRDGDGSPQSSTPLDRPTTIVLGYLLEGERLLQLLEAVRIKEGGLQVPVGGPVLGEFSLHGSQPLSYCSETDAEGCS